MTKDFDTAAVLSVVTGRLMTATVKDSGIARVYEVLNWMTGESVFTHQLPRICQEAVPVILALHPTLQGAIDESAAVTNENWREWLAIWTARYGENLAVPKFSETEHEYRDPVEELVERVGADRVIVIEV